MLEKEPIKKTTIIASREPVSLLLSCEHASAKVPAHLRGCIPQGILKTHLAFDKGALSCAQELSREYQVSLWEGEVSRLVCDLNRSAESPDLFSRYTKTLSPELKKKILERYFLPYRQDIELAVKKSLIKEDNLLHLSIHSFTPVLRGEVRRNDIGILFDPKSQNEKKWADQFRKNFKKVCGLRVAMNEPYKGTHDGLTTYLREHYQKKGYAGIEIEMNQKKIEACTQAVMAMIKITL